jgi:Na+-transporting methylmalonyl-CoA/oxaloacetate decarboxylase beta subunit
MLVSGLMGMIMLGSLFRDFGMTVRLSDDMPDASNMRVG